MKKLLILFSICGLLTCCNKDDDNDDQPLPPITQSGAGTFACKVNGQNFIDTSGGFFNCFYQNVDGEYYFSISGIDNNYKNTNLPWSISFGTIAKTIMEGETLQLIEETNGNAAGSAFFSISTTQGESSTTDINNSGELTITKLDFTNNIVSGTFWFDILNPVTGEIVQIREGYFDTIFTQ
ncbi:DUF6252 family protein [Bizionia paragorgiae]|uniref:Lipocalin-like domain-containing protein n=1 Tax=Bizionia paragorgiae TaxID=283786 RepID=A0A1H4BLP6_BIZPA|nr:DUF6252 family protein [Bizionia paragorgiae]SEA48958.1 hypothetical protein SAMN04487990_11528 [Bizionia paragorgiae]